MVARARTVQRMLHCLLLLALEALNYTEPVNVKE